jgi:glycine/D-amino acid oxidase-like deaminating enzyme
LVIGAGFTGLNAARKLAKPGVKVALIEAEHVCWRRRSPELPSVFWFDTLARPPNSIRLSGVRRK